MSKEMVVRPYQPFELTEKQVTMIAHTSFVPATKRGKIPEIWASIFAGRAMGIDDMTAINKIHMIDGTPAPSAHLASGVVRMRHHSLEISLNEDGTAATAVGVRADTGNRGTETFTMKDAETAGLLGKQNWKKYPKAMLKARATTALCNSLFSDCFMGGVYTPDELGADFVPDEDVVDDDDVIDVKGVEIHEPIPDEADDGLTEPVTATERLVDTDEASPGSASSLADLKKTHGLAAVISVAREHFPNRPVAELDGDELALLAGHLSEAVVGA